MRDHCMTVMPAAASLHSPLIHSDLRTNRAKMRSEQRPTSCEGRSPLLRTCALDPVTSTASRTVITTADRPTHDSRAHYLPRRTVHFAKCLVATTTRSSGRTTGPPAPAHGRSPYVWRRPVQQLPGVPIGAAVVSAQATPSCRPTGRRHRRRPRHRRRRSRSRPARHRRPRWASQRGTAPRPLQCPYRVLVLDARQTIIKTMWSGYEPGPATMNSKKQRLRPAQRQASIKP